jgi:ubiquinone/menaquinone biosynthesis C-methylase UbiE
MLPSQSNQSQSNIHVETVQSFGDEWERFDQSELPEMEAIEIFEEYFAVFPWDALPKDSQGFDMGCGSGRWAKFVAPRVGHLHCIDPSSAINVAQKLMININNVTFHQASIDELTLPAESQDFGYSLGVLHHIPDTEDGLKKCVALLKPNAPFLLYLYYAFENRSWLYRSIWLCSELFRRVVCRLPPKAKHLVTDTLAALIYWPLARGSWLLEQIHVPISGIPLSYYRKHSFYTMRTDSRDRFGTPLEKRFTRQQIEAIMKIAGLRDITFSEKAPFWCAVGIKA